MKKFSFLLIPLFVIQSLAFGNQGTKKNDGKIVLLSENYLTLNPENQQRSSTSTQCLGITKKGLRCKNRTLNASGYCYLHESQNTAKGNNLKKKAVIPNNQTDVTKSGQPIYTGPRGGRYHYSKSGNKVYERK